MDFCFFQKFKQEFLRRNIVKQFHSEGNNEEKLELFKNLLYQEIKKLDLDEDFDEEYFIKNFFDKFFEEKLKSFKNLLSQEMEILGFDKKDIDDIFTKNILNFLQRKF